MVLSLAPRMSSGTLINYLPAHMVYRTPDMQRIYDGFLPTSNRPVHHAESTCR